VARELSHRVRAQGVRIRDLEERLDELREAVLAGIRAHEEGQDAEDVLADLKRKVEHVPAGRWTVPACTAAAVEWAHRYGEPPAAIDWNPAGMRQRHRLEHLDRWAEGDWPSQRTITRLFGSWNHFMVEAGFAPRLGSDPARRGPGGAGKGLDHLPEWEGWHLVHAYRDQRGLSQTRVAERAGISYEYFRMIERGAQTNPGVRVVIAVARALTLPPGALIDAGER
jgi:DNA-binding XRE family transcriptional regulator